MAFAIPARSARAGECDGGELDLLQDCADRLALMIVLAMILLAIRDDRFRFTVTIEHEHKLAALDLLHFT